VVTFPTKKVTFFYESSEKLLYRIDDNSQVLALMSTENNDIPSQSLRRDRFENNLYFFYKENKFAVLQNIKGDGYDNMLQFGGFSAKNVSDFRAVGKQRFIILSKNGNLGYYEFSSKHINKLSELDLNYAGEDLEFCTFNICPKI